MSDDDTAIGMAAKAFSGGHGTVTHKDLDVHSNMVEGLAGQLKRAQLGVFHYISEMHLQRYVDELVFRRNQREAILRKNKNSEHGSNSATGISNCSCATSSNGRSAPN